MEKLSKLIQTVTLFLPTAWVFTCIDLGIRWIYERPFEGLYTLAASSLIAFLLFAAGYWAAGARETDSSLTEDLPLKDSLKRFAILFCALAAITALIISKL